MKMCGNMNIRKIKYLNKMADKGLVVFKGDGRLGDSIQLEEIKFLKRGEDGADEDCFAVYPEEGSWYHLEDCEFFVLKEYKWEWQKSK